MSNQGNWKPLRVSSDDWAEFVNIHKSLSRERTMNEIEKQKAVIAEAWSALEIAGALKCAADRELIAADREQKAFTAWRVECSRLKTLEESNE